MITLKRVDTSDGDQVGNPGWSPAMWSAEGWTAMVRCPGCFRLGSLDGHSISALGVVTPSLECMHGCGFHKRVTLEGWKEYS